MVHALGHDQGRAHVQGRDLVGNEGRARLVVAEAVEERDGVHGRLAVRLAVQFQARGRFPACDLAPGQVLVRERPAGFDAGPTQGQRPARDDVNDRADDREQDPFQAVAAVRGRGEADAVAGRERLRHPGERRGRRVVRLVQDHESPPVPHRRQFARALRIGERLEHGDRDRPGFPGPLADDPRLDAEELADALGSLVQQDRLVDQDQGRGPQAFGQVQGDDGLALARARLQDARPVRHQVIASGRLDVPGHERARRLQVDRGADSQIVQHGVREQRPDLG